MAYDPHSKHDSELSGNFEEIAYVRTVMGSIPTGPDGLRVILPNGKTDITGGWGIAKNAAEHGRMSWNARTPGREKFVIMPNDHGALARRMSRNHPQVIDPDPETGLKQWRWVINETWNNGKVGAKDELRQIVIIARQVPDVPRTVELIDQFISEDDALLPPSEPNPDIVDVVKGFFKELYRRLFKPKSVTDQLFPHREK